MSLPWSAAQLEWLGAMGFDVLVARGAAGGGGSVTGQAAAATAAVGTLAPPAASMEIPAALLRAARGVDLAPLLASGIPRDAPSRRALWRALRPLRKAARAR